MRTIFSMHNRIECWGKEELRMIEMTANAYFGSACGTKDPEKEPAPACGTACGTKDPEKEPAPACGTACGTKDPK